MNTNTLTTQLSGALDKYPRSVPIDEAQRTKALTVRKQFTDKLLEFNSYAEAQKNSKSRPYYSQCANLIKNTIEAIADTAGREVYMRTLEHADAKNPWSELAVLLESYITERVDEQMRSGTDYHDVYRNIRDELSIFKNAEAVR